MDSRKVKEQIAQVFDDVAEGLKTGSFGARPKVGLTLLGSEHGEAEMRRGAELAAATDASIEVVLIGPKANTHLVQVEAATVPEAQQRMDRMLEEGGLDAAVTMHYSFPIGVTTVGKALTPGFGREMFIASTTGASDTDRASALLKNAISGIATAKACGQANPTLGILNLDGARQLERALLKLSEGGYPVRFAESARSDGGAIMRGNDLLQGVPDICVMDSLTGNVIMKLMSAYATGGNYEALGSGYGPGVGEAADRIVGIISRASGAPVVAGALRYMGACVKGGLLARVKEEFALARKAGLDAVLQGLAAEGKKGAPSDDVKMPPEKVATEEIAGVEILVLDEAVRALWKRGVYAASGMGCTGPVIMVAEADREAAIEALKAEGYL